MNTLLADLRYGLRTLLRSPGFAVVAILTVALGIGANTAMFSVLHAVLLRPLPYPDSDRLAVIWETVPARNQSEALISYPTFRDWKTSAGSFESMAAFFENPNQDVNLTGGTEPERINVARVTSGYFGVLGVQPALGRAFTAEEDRVGNHRVAILSHALWVRQFSGDPSIVGESVGINGFPYTVLGIMPDGFQPVGSLALNKSVDMWRPLAPSDDQMQTRTWRNLRVIARLAEGSTIAQAVTEMEGISARLATEFPESDGERGVRVVSLHDQAVQGARPALLVLFAAVGLVLLIACVNVANLLLTKGSARSREVAVRIAMGAPRTRVFGQLLTESLLLAGAGGLIGVALAVVVIQAIVAIGPSRMVLLGNVELSVPILGFTALLALATGVVFGVAPAYQASTIDVGERLKDGGRSASTQTGRRLSQGLVVAEIALSLVLLVGAGLLIRSFDRLLAVDPGFSTEGLVTMQLELPMVTKYPEQHQRNAFFDELRDRVLALPGVVAATTVGSPPLSSERGWSSEFGIEGRPELDQGTRPAADLRLVGPAFFETMGIPLSTGRPFNSSDVRGGERVAVVNQAMAETFWPGADPIGGRLDVDWFQADIVGVAGDVRLRGLEADVRPTIYLAQWQYTFNFTTLVVRTSGDPSGLIQPVRAEIRAMDPEQPVYNVRTMQQLIAGSTSERRFNLNLLTAFAGLAFVLSAIGIYGVVSYTFSQRRTEVGIRMALGATPADALRLVLGDGGKLTLIGLGVGVLVAAVLTQFMRSLLYDIGAMDPLTYALAALALLAVGVAASGVPAVRAVRTDPVESLRAE
jgi:putative ABC transport system permease protein